MKIENNRKIVRIKSLFLVLALVVGMLGGCFVSNAAEDASNFLVYDLGRNFVSKIGLTYISGDEYRNLAYGVSLYNSNEETADNIYMSLFINPDKMGHKIYFISKSPFTYDTCSDSSYSEEPGRYPDLSMEFTNYSSANSTNYNGQTYYYFSIEVGLSSSFFSSTYYHNQLTASWSLADTFDFTYSCENILDPNGSGSLNYAESSSDEIEDVLGVFLNPYTGREDNQTAYLWKWIPPVDTTLLMEISADVEYTDSLTDSLLTAIKNSWSTKHVSLFTYEDEILGSNGSIKFTYDDVKEKVAEEIGEEPQKIRLKNVYFRYAKIDEEESVVNYGNYTTFTPNYKSYMDVLPEVGVVTYPTGNHHSGVTENYDPKTDTIPETNVNISKPDDYEDIDGLFGTIQSYLNSGKSFIGDFPSLMGDIFENIPPQIISIITIGLGLLVVLRLFGR